MKQLDTPFEAYEFESEEFAVAAVFSLEQTAHIKTELAAFAAKKATLAYNPALGVTAKDTFIQEHEYLRGACDALASLLTTSDNTKSDLLAVLEAKAKSQAGT